MSSGPSEGVAKSPRAPWPPSGFRRQRRNFPIWRIDNQRRSPGWHDLVSAVEPEIIVGSGYVGFGSVAAPVSIGVRRHPLFIRNRFLLRKEFFPGEVLGAFKGCDGGVGPQPLQSGWPSAVRGAVQVFAATLALAWPAAGAGASNTAAVAAASALMGTRNRRVI